MNGAQQRGALDAAIAGITALVRAVIAREGVPVTEEQRGTVALQVFRQIQQARNEAHAVASLQLGQPRGLPELPPEYRLKAPMALIQEVVAKQGVTESTRRDPLVAKKSVRAISRGLQRHAEQPARELVVDYAETTEGAWQRVLTGPTSCAFCAMLASRGPIYTDKHEALTGNGAGESVRDGRLLYVYHDGCDCIVIFVPAGSTSWEGRTQWKRLQHMWNQADKSEDERDIDRPTANVFRSFWEAEVRQGNGVRYIADSIAQAA